MSSRWPFLPPRPDSIRHRLIFALDVETFAEAERLVQLLAKDVGVFKVGKQLFLHSGPEVVRMIHRYGVDVFLISSSTTSRTPWRAPASRRRGPASASSIPTPRA